jgi:hypothetical protein
VFRLLALAVGKLKEDAPQLGPFKPRLHMPLLYIAITIRDNQYITTAQHRRKATHNHPQCLNSAWAAQSSDWTAPPHTPQQR